MTAREHALQLWQNDPRVKALYEEARLQRGKKNFCRSQYWYATPGDSGMVGLKFLMLQIPLGDAYDFIYHAILDALPPCKHKGGCRSYFPEVLGSRKREKKVGFFSLLDLLRGNTAGKCEKVIEKMRTAGK
jgi:hypothetical protein